MSVIAKSTNPDKTILLAERADMLKDMEMLIRIINDIDGLLIQGGIDVSQTKWQSQWEDTQRIDSKWFEWVDDSNTSWRKDNQR